ncbi:hypothetical protein H9Q69_005662 [Fusarium xylarioides]|nr:hypothetical protein H9Q69_005662 [Fusarium xylarioides]
MDFASSGCISQANMVSATGRLGQTVRRMMSTATENPIGAVATVSSKALISTTSSLLKTVAHNAIEDKLYGTYYGLVSAGSHLVNGGELAMAQTSA